MVGGLDSGHCQIVSEGATKAPAAMVLLQPIYLADVSLGVVTYIANNCYLWNESIPKMINYEFLCTGHFKGLTVA